MNIYTTDEEQVERIKRWLKEYGPTVIISILVVVVGTFSWRFWLAKVDNVRASASNSYEQLLSNAMNNVPGVQAQAQHLIKQYASTPYAKLAALLLAKVDINTNNMADAKKQLKWVIHSDAVGSIKQIARNRLARIYIAENKGKEAIKLLQTVDDKSYQTAIDAILGDAYVSTGDIANARKSYQAALALLPSADDNRPLLTMKLNDLPVS